MLPSYAPWDGMGWDLLWVWCRHRSKDCFTDFRTFFFSLQPTSLFLVSDLQFYIEITKGTLHHCIWQHLTYLAHIRVCQIWSSGVSLKKSCKMKLRWVELRSIWLPSWKSSPNQILVWRPNCNFNVELEFPEKKVPTRGGEGVERKQKQFWNQCTMG